MLYNELSVNVVFDIGERKMNASEIISLTLIAMCEIDGDPLTEEERLESMLPNDEANDWLRRISAGYVRLGMTCGTKTRRPALYQ